VTTTRRRLLAGLLGFVGLLALLYVADVAMASGKVPRGTRVLGVPIGGKSRADAKRVLAARLHPPATMGVALPGSKETYTFDPAAVGLRVDLDRTVDQARAAGLSPLARVRAVFGTNDVSPVATVDDGRLRDALARWAKKVDRNPREGSVRFDGTTPVPVLPHDGRTVDVARTAAAVVAAYPTASGAAAFIETEPVKTTEADVTHAVAAIAQPAVAAPVSLSTSKDAVTMTPAQIAAVLRIDTDPDGRITPKLNEKRLDEILLDTLKPVETPATNAQFVVGKGAKITVTPSKKGTKVDRAALAGALLPVLAQPAPRNIPLTIVASDPKITTALAKTLGVKEKVGEFTTYHPCCRARVQNIHVIADIVDGAVVLPGETFSLNGFVGERDRGRGFVEAPMILNGKFVPAVGGGVSQFATTMFNAVFFGGFEDVQHKPHSYYISRYPPGREATVSSPQPDLRWRNDSKYGVLVTTSYTGRSITVTFWSTKRYDVESVTGERYRFRSVYTQYDSSPTCESTSGVPGFDIDVWRVFKVGGKEVRREKFHTRYLPEPRFVCRR
jgi:vancomycin resistance protein YoaR